MNYAPRNVENEKTVKNHEYWFPLYEQISDFVFLIFTIATTVHGLWDKETKRWQTILFVLLTCFAVISVIAKVVVFLKKRKSEREFEFCRTTEKLSVTTLNALISANSAKMRAILQSTYGNVPGWHPMNYCKNVLVYDIHEQIRSILIGLQQVIIETNQDLNDDNVSVDIIYCYPDKLGYNGEIPFSNEAIPTAQGQDKKEKADVDKYWKLITSGNHSSSGLVHTYLKSQKSFYAHVDNNGYLFYNDKKDCQKYGHYVPSEKDREHGDDGSIVGLKIELKNDEPEEVFVKAILTITTYGKKLYSDEKIDLDSYKLTFKNNIINSYKSLLSSELAQMFIRHAIRDGYMCRCTGKLFDRKHSKNNQSEEEENGCHHACTLERHCPDLCDCKNRIS